MPDQADGLQLGICTGEGGIEEEVFICVKHLGSKETGRRKNADGDECVCGGGGKMLVLQPAQGTGSKS